MAALITHYFFYREQAGECRIKAAKAAREGRGADAITLTSQAQAYDRAAEALRPQIPQAQWDAWYDDRDDPAVRQRQAWEARAAEARRQRLAWHGIRYVDEP